MVCHKYSWRYTEAENKELKIRPIGSYPVNYTNDQLMIRKKIGKRMCDYFNETNPISLEFKNMYEVYPMWKFYVDKNGTPRRIYGMKNESGNWKAHATPVFIESRLQGEVPLSELMEVKVWTEEHFSFIKLSDDPGVFTDPLGYMLLLRYHYSI